MSRRHVIVTGGSMGIGLAASRALAERGVRLTLVARGAEALRSAAAELPGDGHRTHALDVSDERAWPACVEQLGELHGLVCAAGMLGPIGPIGEYAPTDFRRTIEVNLLGTLLAIHHCLPALRAGRGAIVTFGGGGATAPLPRYDAYASSKAAVVRLSENLAGELLEDGVRINCVAPGFVATRMHERTLAAGPQAAGADYFERTQRELESGGVPASEAAELVCQLLEGDPDARFTGKLISAQWDPWREPRFRRRLTEEVDLATLRRIDDALFTTVGRRASA
jgi:NAD(P)-dependent dehydrogenase (short-subunit alcohol dehydrogenase family)